jgi:hypothetical protein
MHKIGMNLPLFLPTTKRQGGEVAATVKLDQRVGRVLERSMRWFVEFQKSFRYLKIEKEFDACFDQIGI